MKRSTRKPANPVAEPEPAIRVLRQFRIVFIAVKAHFQQVEHSAGASGAQVWALHLVCERPGLGVSELANAMDVRQPTASGFVKALAAQGLVEIRREGADRRAVQLHPSAAGRTRLRAVSGPFSGVLPQALKALDDATLDRLEHDLATLIGRLRADRRAGSVPLGGGTL